MKKEKQYRRREEFSEESKFSNYNEAIELSDVENGTNVDSTSTNYLYQDKTWLSYRKMTSFFGIFWIYTILKKIVVKTNRYVMGISEDGDGLLNHGGKI